jgi:hypothetical protein
VVCRSCGMETRTDDYRDQIEARCDRLWEDVEEVP